MDNKLKIRLFLMGAIVLVMSSVLLYFKNQNIENETDVINETAQRHVEMILYCSRSMSGGMSEDCAELLNMKTYWVDPDHACNQKSIGATRVPFINFRSQGYAEICTSKGWVKLDEHGVFSKKQNCTATLQNGKQVVDCRTINGTKIELVYPPLPGEPCWGHADGRNGDPVKGKDGTMLSCTLVKGSPDSNIKVFEFRPVIEINQSCQFVGAVRVGNENKVMTCTPDKKWASARCERSGSVMKDDFGTGLVCDGQFWNTK